MTETLTSLVRVLWSALAGSTAPNLRLVRVLAFYPPGPLVTPQGTTLPWPASVDVQPVSTYLATAESPGALRSTEAPIGRGLARGVWPPVLRVPILYPGDESLAIVSPVLPGVVGLLVLAGTHFGAAPSVGESDSTLPPDSSRMSDAVFIPGFLLGATAATLPPSVAPQNGASPVLAPRGPEAAGCYLERAGTEWTLAGSQIKLGTGASVPVAGVGDSVDAGAALIAWAANVTAALAALGQPVAPLAPSNVGVISSGSATVKRI